MVDVLFWPVQLALAGLQWIAQLVRAAHRPARGVPILTPQRTRERGGLWLRLLVLLPFMIFVLFPFLLDHHHVAEIDAADQRADLDLLAGAGDARAVWRRCSGTRRF